MAERAETLANKLETANNDAISTVGACSDEQWGKTCAEEGWTVAVTAHHIASGYAPLTGLVQAMASGADLPGLTMDQIDEGNKAHQAEFASVSVQDTVDLLKSGGSAAVAAIRGLSDEQLERKAVLLQGNPEMTTEQVIEGFVIGSTTGHMASIKKTI